MWSALEHAYASVGGFVRRHKTLVVATGVTAACSLGCYYAYTRMVSEAQRFTRQLQSQMAQHQRLQLSLASATEESHATVLRFLPRLKKKIYALVDLESVVQQLKQLDKSHKSERKQLWQQAKLLAVTRYFTALLAMGAWHLLVFAQVSIIGKRVFEKGNPDNQSPLFRSDEDARDQAAAQAQHEFLVSGLEYFLNHGLERIKSHVETAVAANPLLQSWDVTRKAKVERQELSELLQEIFLTVVPSPVSSSAEEDSPELARWRSFLIYADKQPGQSEQVISLLNDLWDLLESELFLPALQQSLGFLCGKAFQDVSATVYGVSQRVEEEDQVQSKPAPPLAKLIPCLQAETGKMLSPGLPEGYLESYSQGVGEMEAFRTFYEAIFFQQDDSEVGGQLI